MKRIAFILAILVMTATSISAQVVPGMKYSELKDIYNPRNYVKTDADPYSMLWSGVASFAVPGLGQLICKETGRGIAIFAGDVAFGMAGGFCANKFRDYCEKDANGKYKKDADGNLVVTDENAAKKWGIAFLGVAAGNFCYWIWNICDARKVAKVKNMYYQDLQKHAFEFNMYPTVNYAMTSNGMKPVAGMTMSMQF